MSLVLKEETMGLEGREIYNQVAQGKCGLADHCPCSDLQVGTKIVLLLRRQAGDTPE